jgi:CelD/BcsL family acetyltransferase involved in cellulose biosynthesis
MAPGRSPLPPDYDALVDRSVDLDRVCSSSDWVLPALATWGTADPVVAREGDAAVALGRAPLRRGVERWCGLDPTWGFACPVVGPDTDRAADLTARCLRGSTRWDAVLLTGLVPGSAREAAVTRRLLQAEYRLFEGPSMTRQVADVHDGVDAWLARRSARFRRNLRRAERSRRAAGVELQLVNGGGREIVERCRAVERRSWKGQRSAGLRDEDFAGFYRHLADRVAASGRLRAGFARDAGRDVAYILGVVRGGTYRGLQLSYDAQYRELSLGNVLQFEQLSALVGEGVHHYDLGMDMPYKRHWADTALTTRTIVVVRR